MKTIKQAIQESLKTSNLDADFDEIRREVKEGLHPGYEVGIGYAFDNIFKFANYGQHLCIGGVPSTGKSTLVDFITMQMAINHNWVWLYWTPESAPCHKHMRKLCQAYLGKPVAKEFNGLEKATAEDIDRAEEFIKAHYIFIDPYVCTTIDKMMETALLYRQPGAAVLTGKPTITGVVLDSWNCLNMNKARGQSETDWIGEKLNALRVFTKSTGLQWITAAHPSKPVPQSNGEYPRITLYTLHGSSHWYNKLDNGIILHRSWEDKTDGKCLVEVRTAKIKDDDYGKFSEVKLRFIPAFRRYVCAD